MTAHGHFHWNELRTRNIEAVKRFYGETIGWTFEETKTPDGHAYWVAKMGDAPVAGLFPLVAPYCDEIPESWIGFLAVDDVDARVRKAQAAGATLVMPVFEFRTLVASPCSRSRAAPASAGSRP